MSFLGASVKPDQSVAGRGAVYVGDSISPYTALPSAMYSVGACEGILSVSPNQDVIKLNRTDAQNPYAVLETTYDFQISLSLQEVDIFNLALATGYFTESEAFEDITGGYSSDTSGHHGVLHSSFLLETSVSGNNSIDSLYVGAGSLTDYMNIYQAAGSDIFDGFDATSNSPDWIIFSGLTHPSLLQYNNMPYRISSVGAVSNQIQILSTTYEQYPGNIGHFYATDYGSYENLPIGQLRRLYALPRVSFTPKAVDDDDKVIQFYFSEVADMNNFEVGDVFKLTHVGWDADPTGGTSSVNLLKQIENQALVVSTVGVGGNLITCNYDTGSSEVAYNNQVVYGVAGGTDVIDIGFIDKASKLVFGSDSQAGYRSLMLRVEGGKDTSGNREVAEWQFYKCKIVYDGSIEYDRSGVVTYPVTVHCLGNNSDVIGQYITPNDFTRTNYYGES